jgi:hypothetical protein
MKKVLILFGALLMFAFSCDRVKEKTKETLNKSGETIGEGATEFFEGVSEGVDRTLQCEISISQKLLNKGLSTGKFSIENSKIGGENNVLVLYIIFEDDFTDTLTAKAYDKQNLETGRAKLKVEAKAGDAGYFDFVFDERTYIEVKSKIIID